jgi:hypothetical protein
MPRCYAPAAARAINPALTGTDSPWAPSLDHIVRKCDGGTDRDENLRAAHRWCNQRHGTLAEIGRQSRLRLVPAVSLPEPLQLDGLDVASRVGAGMAGSLAALAARLEADAAAFSEETESLDVAGFTDRTLNLIGAASDPEEEAAGRRRWLGWLRRRLRLPRHHAA